MKTFASNKPADIKVQLEAHFVKFEPTHPGIRRVQGLRNLAKLDGRALVSPSIIPQQKEGFKFQKN